MSTTILLFWPGSTSSSIIISIQFLCVLLTPTFLPEIVVLVSELFDKLKYVISLHTWSVCTHHVMSICKFQSFRNVLGLFTMVFLINSMQSRHHDKDTRDGTDTKMFQAVLVRFTIIKIHIHSPVILGLYCQSVAFWTRCSCSLVALGTCVLKHF